MAVSIKILDQEYELQQGVTVVGRGDDADITVPSKKISSVHARFTVDGDSVFIEDLGSTNHTFVNNQQVDAKRELLKGDTIRFGDEVCQLILPKTEPVKAAANAAPAAPAGDRNERIERMRSLQRRKMIQNGIVGAVLLVAVLFGLQYWRNYVPPELEQLRQELKDTLAEIEAIELADDAAINAEGILALDTIINRMRQVSPVWPEELKQANDLAAQAEELRDALENRNRELTYEQDALARIEQLEKMIDQYMDSPADLVRLRQETEQFLALFANSKTAHRGTALISTIDGRITAIAQVQLNAAAREIDSLAQMHRYQAAIDRLSIALGETYPDSLQTKVDALRARTTVLKQDAESYMQEIIRASEALARREQYEKAEKSVRTAFDLIGIMALQAMHDTALARINEIRSEMLAAARKRVAADILKAETFFNERKYHQADALYAGVLKQIQNKELKNEINLKYLRCNMYKNGLDEVIAWLAGKGEIDLSALGDMEGTLVRADRSGYSVVSGDTPITLGWKGFRAAEFRGLFGKASAAGKFHSTLILAIEKIGNKTYQDLIRVRDLIELARKLDETRCAFYEPLYGWLYADIKVAEEKAEAERVARRLIENPGEAYVRLGKSNSQPYWAKAELEMFASIHKAFMACIDKFFDIETGKPCAQFHWATADDVAEGVATWDRTLMLTGHPELVKAYTNIWKYLYKAQHDMGGFANGFYTKAYDWEHIGELLQIQWGALDMNPYDKELHDQNVKIANVFIGPAYNKKTKLLKHELMTVSGGSGASFDTVANMGYITPVFHAYCHTGNAKYKNWILEYVTSWNELAAKNDGIFPYVVSSSDRSIPERWYHEVDGGFSYETWGTVTTVRGMQGWANAVGIAGKGDPQYFSGINSFIDAMCSFSDKFVPASNYGPNGWFMDKDPWWIPILVGRPYAASFTDDMAERIQKYYKDASGTQRGLLDWHMFTYFGKGSPGLAEARFVRRRQMADDLYKRVEAVTSLPQTGDDITAFTSFHPIGIGYADGTIFGVYDNGRCGGVTNASIRYWKGDKAIGLPPGVAALVRHVGKTSMEVWLYNANESETPMFLTAGYYGQHMFESMKTSCGTNIRIENRKLKIVLRPESLTEITFKLKRHHYTPVVNPWN